LVLPSDLPEIKCKIAGCEISLQNASKDDLPNESLAAQVVLEAGSLAEAEESALEKIREFFNLFSFVTCSGFRVARTRFVMDWTPGVEIREQYAFGQDDDRADRWPDLAAEYLLTLQELISTENSKKLRNALRPPVAPFWRWRPFQPRRTPRRPWPRWRPLTSIPSSR
jgi:hypothetical protein